MQNITRRSFLAQTAALATATPLLAQPRREKLPVAAVVTEYRRNSHADVILGKILEGYDQMGGPGPDLRLVSLYVDQFNKADISRDLAQKHGFPMAKTIEEAVTVGGEKIPVAGVIIIGEHGSYPYTKDTNQHMYPRRQFFDAVSAAYRKYRRVVPTFNDKHLAYAWRDAKHIYDTAKEMNIPFLAGSSAPVSWRVPALELPRNCELTEAISMGYGGVESYGFHAVETLQCMVERRKGGETGIAAVQAVRGEEIARAEKAGRWSRELLEAAAATTEMLPKGRAKEFNKNTTFFLLEYRDGLKAAVAMSTGMGNEFSFAGRIQGEPRIQATCMKLEEKAPYGHFSHLVRAIEHTIHTGRPAYPVERTLLTTGALDALMHSLANNGELRKTPELAITYQPSDWRFAQGAPPA